MSPIYPKLKEASAIFGQVMGYERPNWFDRDNILGTALLLLKIFFLKYVNLLLKIASSRFEGSRRLNFRRKVTFCAYSKIRTKKRSTCFRLLGPICLFLSVK